MSHTFLFTIRRCLTCSLYAISEIRESNQHLFPSMSSFNSPLLASSPPCHRIKHTPYLFILFYFYYYSSARKEVPQIPVTYNTLPAEPLIDFFDRNVLIRSLQMAWKDARRREGKRRGKVEEGRKSLLAFWHLPAFICVAFPEYGSKLGACMRTCYRARAERLYNYNARLIKEKEYNRFQMNLCD